MWDQRTYEDTDYGLDLGEAFEPAPLEGDATVDPMVSPHVMTVLGPVAPDEIGVCLHHEHILCDPVAVTDDEPDYRLDDIDRACQELEAFVTVGGKAIVDASSRDYGRDVRGLAAIAKRVPVHIIAVTGRHKHLHAALMSNSLDIDSLTDEFVEELTEGISAERIRPGLIKIGSSLNEMTPVEEATARAAARAHLATGAPVTTHLEAGTHGHHQLDVLEHEGVDPSRVILGHLDRALDRQYLSDLLQRGAFCSFDQIGKRVYGEDVPKIKMLLDLVGAGFEDQLLVSQDYARKSLLTAYGGSPGIVHLLERFTLDLMANGASSELVMKLVVDNPARALTTFPVR